MYIRLAQASLIAIGTLWGVLAAKGQAGQELLPHVSGPLAQERSPQADRPAVSDIVLPLGPAPLRLDFTGPREGFPPRPRDMRDVREVPWQPIRGRLTDELAARLRQTALQDAGVQEQLGRRFAYIGTEEAEPPKGRELDDAGRRATVTFYSYTHRTTVEVDLQRDKVVKVEPRPRYQPQAGAEEIEAAVRLAREDTRIRSEVQGLAGDAIVMAAPPDTPQASEHRLLYVTFGKAEADEPEYFAVVDLTAERVWVAGPSLPQ
jgi:hypothetical protein